MALHLAACCLITRCRDYCCFHEVIGHEGRERCRSSRKRSGVKPFHNGGRCGMLLMSNISRVVRPCLYMPSEVGLLFFVSGDPLVLSTTKCQ